MRRGTGDAGFATVWVVAAMALVATAFAAAIGYGVAAVDRHRAAAAADATALAVALAAVQGQPAACRDGAALAARNGATVTHCVLNGAIADVEVAVPLPGVLSRLGPAVGRARAGPASES